MNLILFEEPFESVCLSWDDWRTEHLHKVLHVGVGTRVFIGFVNGLRARAEVVEIKADGSIVLQIAAMEPAPDPLPVTLLIGLPRPHTARRILFEAASMGVSALHFFSAERSNLSYAQSRLWRTNEWRERILRGTEQAFGTRIPEVILHETIDSALAAQKDKGTFLALDNYEAETVLGADLLDLNGHFTLAVGPERGWSAVERKIFIEHGWQLTHLGPHVMRTETACVAAVAAIASKLLLWKTHTQTQI